MSSGQKSALAHLRGVPGGRPALSKERMLKLMAYADGELEGAEREEVEGWLASDLDAVRFVNEVAGLGELVGIGHRATAEAKAVASFDIADAVMASVKDEKTPEKRAANEVVSIDAARSRRAAKLKVGGMIAAALALAASVFVMTRHKDEAPMARGPAPIVQPSPSGSAEPGVDVDLVETAGDSVRVFYLSSESSPTTSVVVWVGESGGK